MAGEQTDPSWFADAAAQRLPAAHWLEQAEIARRHALSRPAGDLKGFCDAVNDAAAFRRLAALSKGDRP